MICFFQFNMMKYKTISHLNYVLILLFYDFFPHRHWLTNTYAWFGLPYFLYDLWAMYNTHYYLNKDLMLKMTAKDRVVHYIKANKAMLVHHLILPIFFFPSILVM